MNQREEYQEENPGHSSSKRNNSQKKKKNAIKIPYQTCFQKLISRNYS